MLDLAWLSKEAVQVHAFFESLFYLLVTVFLLLGVVVEYFRMPLGGTASVGTLVGRAFVAAFLLHTYPEISRLIADVTDSIAGRLGDFNQIMRVLNGMSDKYLQFSLSWISVKGSLVMLVSFLGFFLLYFTVFVAQAFVLYTWTLLYVFSPILIALFVIPQTAAATSALYRSLMEVCVWKIVWAVLATLLWSAAVSDLAQTNILTALCFNLILAGSLIVTPLVVHSLASKGLAGMNGTLGGIAIGGLATVTPSVVARVGLMAGKKMFNRSLNAGANVAGKRFPKANQLLKNVPRFRVPKKPPLFIKPRKANKTQIKGDKS
jgi:hypothetical protein